MINSKAPRKNTNPGKSCFNDAGYMELKMKAPIKLHKVSNDAVAENKAPKKEEMFWLFHYFWQPLVN